jgi:hypothetical protein
VDEIDNDGPADKGIEQRSTRKKPLPSWAIRDSPDFDLIRFLKADESVVPDRLLELPKPNHTYIDKNGRLKDPNKYARYLRPPKKHTIPPKLQAHIKAGTVTSALRHYYQDLPDNMYVHFTYWKPLKAALRELRPL